LAAQAAEKKSGAPISLVWPLPPEKPRIKWLESISTSRDIGADKQSALQRFVVGFEAPKIMMEKPYGITVDREGRIYVTDTGKNPAVHVFDKKAKKAWQIGAKGRVQLQLPIGVAVDDQEGTVWVSDAKARVIYAFAINGDPISAIGQEGEFQNPTGLAIDSKRRVLYVADSRAHVVKSYRLDGTPLATIGGPGNKDGYFNFPTNVAVDHAGRLWVVDSMNFRVQVFEDGKFVKKFGELGDSPGTFSRPRGMGFDSEGHIYVADAAFNNYQIFDDQGRLLLYVGNGGANPGQFHLPAGMFVDKNNRIYVVDQLNARVQVF
jgi:DNA-binding beta-propeller fold protein YncE